MEIAEKAIERNSSSSARFSAPMREIVGIFTHKVDEDYFGVQTGINTHQIMNASRLVSSVTGVPVPPNATTPPPVPPSTLSWQNAQILRC